MTNSMADMLAADAYVARKRIECRHGRTDQTKFDRQLLAFIIKDMQTAFETGNLAEWIERNEIKG